MRILVAEDNKTNQRLFKMLLERRGHQVETADNGEMAVEMAASGRFQMVFMDIRMPGMDGIAASSSMQKMGPNRPYIVACTADVTIPTRNACKEAGLDAFIPKPVRQARLDQALAEAEAFLSREDVLKEPGQVRET